METEIVLNRLSNEAEGPAQGSVALTKKELRLVLNRVNQLESMAADLLRSQFNGSKTIVINFPAARTPL